MPRRRVKAQAKAKSQSPKQGRVRKSVLRSTSAERALWKYLRDGALGGFRFERNYRVEGREFPFFCRAAKLAIAIDSETARRPAQRDYRFDTYLLARGIMVGHFSDKGILREAGSVAEQILVSCRSRTTGRQIVPTNHPVQTTLPAASPKIEQSRPLRRAWIAGFGTAAILIVLILFLAFQLSRSIQPTVAEKPLASLTPAPSRTAQGPTQTLVVAVFATATAERQSASASDSIFSQAENYLDVQPQSAIDLLLPHLNQFIEKADREDAYSLLGRAELKLQHYHAAAGYLKQLAELEPSPEYLYSLAVAYDLDGDWQNALTSYRQLAASNGTNAVIYRASALQRVKELEARLVTPAP